MCAYIFYPLLKKHETYIMYIQIQSILPDFPDDKNKIRDAMIKKGRIGAEKID